MSDFTKEQKAASIKYAKLVAKYHEHKLLDSFSTSRFERIRKIIEKINIVWSDLNEIDQGWLENNKYDPQTISNDFEIWFEDRIVYGIK